VEAEQIGHDRQDIGRRAQGQRGHAGQRGPPGRPKGTINFGLWITAPLSTGLSRLFSI
jgi:hypothetical protein